MLTDASSLLALGAVFVLAGTVKGVIGLGLPTVSMGLLALLMPPVQAAALLVIPSFVTNAWQMAIGRALGRLLRRLWPMMLGIVAGTWLGAMWIALSEAATTALGIALVVYAAINLTPARFSIPPGVEWWLSPVIGAVTGATTAGTGVFVIPGVPYLQALGLRATIWYRRSACRLRYPRWRSPGR